jgi:FAD/FMN-containing dehydrogenase
MEHPLRVEEFVPSAAPRSVEVEAPALAPAPSAATAPTPLPPLPDLPASDVLFLKPSDAQYAAYLPAANTRTQLSPALRAVCKTEHAVAVMVDWVRTNGLSFAVRCGGHSYEGFSQSSDVVIDLRGLAAIAVDKAAGTVTVGAGADLFQIYQALAAQGLALQAGSCPTVGISGHILGGGHGLLARSHGLTCDSLQRLTIVDAQARTLQADATSSPTSIGRAAAAAAAASASRRNSSSTSSRSRARWCSASRGCCRSRTRRACSPPGRPGRRTRRATSPRS